MPPTAHHDPLHVGGQPSEGAAATATHTQQERIAQSLAQGPADAADMAHGIHKEDQLQLGCVDLVVVLHVLLNYLHHLGTRDGGKWQALLHGGVPQLPTSLSSDPEMSMIDRCDLASCRFSPGGLNLVYLQVQLSWLRLPCDTPREPYADASSPQPSLHVLISSSPHLPIADILGYLISCCFMRKL